ncbi:TPA: hypothetical protein JAW44_002781 [Citrobacter werkmanii]|uniref:Uncharacterized protein n=1 Tax=Citrobacter werkmanii TaxID=67827 RepID=A0AA37ZBA6_9ENTR|nr:hypothetical protein [Citrobacter werkmanii]
MFEFQFSYFTKGQFIDNSPESIFPLITAFENKFLPSFADEITPMGVRKVIRIVGINEFENISVLFASEAVNINMLYRDTKPENADVIKRLDFITNALSKVKAGAKAWRLASIVTSIERVTPENNEKMYAKFFNDDYQGNFFEWNTRRAKREQHGSEIFNVVATTSRGPVMNSNSPSETFDAIVIQLDVNTVPENSLDRFAISSEHFWQLVDIARENVDYLLG